MVVVTRLGKSCCFGILLTFTTAAHLFAQDQVPEEEVTSNRSVTIPAGAVSPMSVGAKFRYRFRHAVDAGQALRLAAGSGIDQARNSPREWGQDADAFGIRVASHFGQHFIKEQLLFAVEALDHENPVRIHSTRAGFKNRLIDAVKYTFIVRNDNGEMMFSYSRLIADYGAGFISRTWYPQRLHSFGSGLQAGTTSLALDVGMNVLREFWPDLKRLIRR